MESADGRSAVQGVFGIGWIVILERRLFPSRSKRTGHGLCSGPIVIASLNWRGEGIQGSARECHIGSIEMEGSYAFSLESWGRKCVAQPCGAQKLNRLNLI